MSPVQVYHICEVCGKRRNRDDEVMVGLRTTVDRHQETLALDYVCQDCRHAIHEACRTVITERRGRAGKAQDHVH